MDDLKKISLICENCGGTLQVDEGKEIIACPYCGNKTLIVESDAVTMERIRTSAQKEVELEKIRVADREQQRILEKEEQKEQEQRAKEFKKGKWSKVLIVLFVIAGFFTFGYFSDGSILAGILSLLQTVCFGVAWAMGMQIIKEKRRYIHILIVIIGLLLMVPILEADEAAEEKAKVAAVKEVKWSIIFMGEEIPEPNSKKLEIHTNTAEELWINVVATTEEEYYEYIAACKEAGYTLSAKESSIGYAAYNEAGYYLDLSHYSSNEEMSIRLEAPRKTVALNWESHDISGVLPQPESSEGAYEAENDKRVVVIVSKTDKAAFEQYVEDCKLYGFEIEAESKGNYYAASDDWGQKVELSYTEGNSEMKIVLEYPKEEEPDEVLEDDTTVRADATTDDTTKAEPEVTEAPGSIDIPEVLDELVDEVIDPQFKETMDEYEAFFDEYIALMEKVEKADTMEYMDLLDEYMEYLEQYTVVMEKMAALEDEDMNTAEALYYAEVTGRIYQKLETLD